MSHCSDTSSPSEVIPQKMDHGMQSQRIEEAKLIYQTIKKLRIHKSFPGITDLMRSYIKEYIYNPHYVNSGEIKLPDIYHVLIYSFTTNKPVMMRLERRPACFFKD